MHQTSLDKSIKIAKESSRSQSQCSTEGGIRSTLRNQPLARDLNLKSVNELKESVENETCTDTLSILQDMTFVGCLERELAVVQHQTSLFIINTQLLSQQLFYQLALFNLGNLGYFQFEQPLSIYDLAIMALEDPDAEWTPSDGPRDKLAQRCAKFLNSKGTIV